ncbi:MAG: AAA family ATPase [Hyperionvirus sp.]|uniref:AAA family ATPase n=1 Tax=Hyperionvirus sp. TaxID=2487770 RepID=A0A3G5A6Z8_9VIRU|nr:MAG: AAA family ATPase [Hyperionvirus sp.]
MSNFTVISNDVKTKGKLRKDITLVFNSSRDPTLTSSLLEITNDEEFYNENIDITRTADTIYSFFHLIKSAAENGNESLTPLASFLAKTYKDKLTQFKKMSDTGKISFDHLPKLFKKGSRFIGKIHGELIGSTVSTAQLVPDAYETGHGYFTLTGPFILSAGDHLVQFVHSFLVYEFKGMMDIKDLPIRLMEDTDHAFLTSRGKIFEKYALGMHHLANQGEMFRVNPYGGVNYFNATGRIMVDSAASKRMNPNYAAHHHHTTRFPHKTIPTELLYKTWPFVPGFSFRAKEWGEIYLDRISEIKFDSNAFDLLVLEPRIKRAIHALVTSSKASFKDIISGKSGGSIFLLYGPPGTGKTLTSEAISEYLQRPLYSVTVGELGVTPKILEKTLSNILEIAQSWDAVILIDEVDIFLEARTTHDIVRNAMVGIFLRLLERHHGVMFLTTNHADRLDEAFKSRISLMVKYNKLDEAALHAVWTNMLSAARITLPKDVISLLAKKPLSGRDIIHVIRGSQSLASSAKEPVAFSHFEEFLALKDIA